MPAIKEKIVLWAHKIFPTAAESAFQKQKTDFSVTSKSGNDAFSSNASLYLYEGDLGVECSSGEIFCKRAMVKNRPQQRAEFFLPQLPNIKAVLTRKGRAYDSIVAVNHTLPADFRTLCLDVLANRALFEEAGIPEGTPLFVSLEIGALPHMQDALEAGYFLPGPTLMTWQREFVKAGRIYELDFPIPSRSVISKTVERARRTFDIRSTTSNPVVFLAPNEYFLEKSEYIGAFRQDPKFDADRVQFIDPARAKLGDLVKAMASAACVVGPTSPYLTAAIFRLPDRVSLVEITEDGEPNRFHKELILSLGGNYISASNDSSKIMAAVNEICPNAIQDE